MDETLEIRQIPVKSVVVLESKMGPAYGVITGTPRERFVESIRRSAGCREPIRVSLIDGCYVLRDGLQRLNAHRDLGLETIKAIIVPEATNEEERAQLAEDLNEHRRHLGRTGQARSYLAAVRRRGRPADVTQGQEAEEDKKAQRAAQFLDEAPGAAAKSAQRAAQDAGFGSPRSAQLTAQIDRQAAPAVREAFRSGRLSQRQAIAISRLNPKNQLGALGQVLTRNAVSPSHSEKTTQEVELEHARAIIKAVEKLSESLRFIQDGGAKVSAPQARRVAIRIRELLEDPAEWAGRARSMSETLVQLVCLVEAESAESSTPCNESHLATQR